MGVYMKIRLKEIALIFIGFSLVACTNTSKQDVGVATGAVAGGLVGSTIGQGTGRLAAIGVGVIAGALIGGSVGK